jgi:predicted acetyltransferase
LHSYTEYKQNSWVNDPYFDYKNIFVAKRNENIIGLIRIVPRQLHINSIPLKLAGISSVCLLPEFQRKGLSVPLMKKTLSYAKEAGYDVSALFARRSADYYYNKFGFFGVAAYSKLLIKNDKSVIDSEFELCDFDIDNIRLYSEAYDFSYEKCSGFIYRNEQYWKYLFSSLQYRNGITFKSIKLKTVTLGYVIYNDNHVYEIAFKKNTDGLRVINFLNTTLGKEQLIVNALTQHRIISFLTEKDVVYQTRECYYGGHMMRILNVESVSEKLAYSGSVSKSLAKPFLPYKETCEILKIWTPSLNQIGHQPFDICEIDHF